MKRTGLALFVCAGVCAALIGGALTLRGITLRAAEKNLMVLHPNGSQRPDDFGTASEMAWLQSGGRKLLDQLEVQLEELEEGIALVVM